MRERVQLLELERCGEKPDLVGGRVQPLSAEELRPVRDVEGTQLRSDDPCNAQPELTDVRRGDVDGVGGETPVAKPRRERLGLLAGRVARERRDDAGW